MNLPDRAMIVSATRMSEQGFWENSALGASLKRLGHDRRLIHSIAFENRLGLSTIYNTHILGEVQDVLLVFVHDDVWIDDYFMVDRLMAALHEYDVVGLAGNRRRVPQQPVWVSVQEVHPDTPVVMDSQTNLSGTVAHGAEPTSSVVTSYGAAPAECELIDGLFIAACQQRLKKSAVLFDPRFDFHFYDLDFCRTARQKGLRIGTWPIAVTHQSLGSINDAWARNYRRYLEKWGS
jgi:GT2 family glycosyltransferase